MSCAFWQRQETGHPRDRDNDGDLAGHTVMWAVERQSASVIRRQKVWTSFEHIPQQ